MLDKKSMLFAIGIMCENIGEKDLARLAKFKELCIKYGIKEDVLLAFTNELNKWEGVHD